MNYNYESASVTTTHDDGNDKSSNPIGCKQDYRSMQSIAIKELKQTFGKALKGSHKLYNSLSAGKKSTFVNEDQINTSAANEKQIIRSSGKTLSSTPYREVKVLPPIVSKQNNKP